MFSQPWFWMYVLGITATKANVFSTKHYENNALIRYQNAVLYFSLIVFILLVTALSPHWWWGPVMWLCGWVAQGLLILVRNPIRLFTALHGSPAGNVLVRSLEMLIAPVFSILAYLFFFFL